eukprot:6248677-Prorocentrum_lima.AAC.1
MEWSSEGSTTRGMNVKVWREEGQDSRGHRQPPPAGEKHAKFVGVNVDISYQRARDCAGGGSASVAWRLVSGALG